MLTLLATVTVGAILLTAAMVGVVWWRQERIAYQPPAYRSSVPSDVRRIHYTASDGQQLLGYLVEPSCIHGGVLIAFHGNADLASFQIPWAAEVARRNGWYVLLAEYRGYGGLVGSPSYLGLREDARAAWRAARHFASTHLSLSTPAFAFFGHSLGSGVAAELAAEIESSEDADLHHSVCAVLLQSPFTSARDMARIVSTRPVQWLWRLIARVHYDSRARVNEIRSPIWIAHGVRDWLVPVSMGRELFARARVPGQLLVVEHAGHNDVVDVGGELYWQWMSEALAAQSTSVNELQSTLRTEMSG